MHVEVTSLQGTSDSKPKEISFSSKDLQFERVTALLKRLSTLILAAIKDAEPTKATVEFGIDVALESGQLTALLVKGEAKGNLKISLEWNRTQ